MARASPQTEATRVDAKACSVIAKMLQHRLHIVNGLAIGIDDRDEARGGYQPCPRDRMAHVLERHAEHIRKASVRIPVHDEHGRKPAFGTGPGRVIHVEAE
jgi:hypothetical protein